VALKKAKVEEGENTQSWLTTFLDMMTLLLTFFILLLSMCSLEAGKVKQVVSACRAAMGALEEGTLSEFSIGTPIVSKREAYAVQSFLIPGRSSVKQTTRMTQLMASLAQMDDISVSLDERGLVVNLGENILFDLGKAKLKEEAFPVLEKLSLLLRMAEGSCRVEGHTDDLPIRTEEFPSNWELSIARAVAVIKYVIRDGGVDPKRLSAVGYGDSRPVVPNDTPEQRAKNRRVELVLAESRLEGEV
jgi:chemotaxis protein MotB